MAASSKIVVDADTKGVVAGAQRAEKAMDKAAKAAGGINRNMKKAGKASKDAGTNMKGFGTEVGKSLLKIDLINQALNQAGAAARQLLNEAAGASASQRERRLSAQGALAGLGVRDPTTVIGQIERAEGVATQQERVQFLQSLQGTGRRFSREEIIQLTKAFSAGGRVAFGEGGQELIRRLQPGVGVGQAIERTLADRPGAVQALRSTEANAQRALVQARTQAERLAADRGTSVEIGRERQRIAQAQGGARASLTAGLDVLTGGLATEAGTAIRSEAVTGDNQLVQSLENLTNELRRRRQPALGSQGENAR